jgi:hypothetical protein
MHVSSIKLSTVKLGHQFQHPPGRSMPRPREGACVVLHISEKLILAPDAADRARSDCARKTLLP